MFKNLSKNLPKTIQKSTQKPPKTTIKKTIGKKTHKIEKSEFGLPTRSLGWSNMPLFETFSSPGVPGTPLGAKMVPRPPPRASRTPPGLNF